MTEWEKDCLRWRGEILTGDWGHWCNEWDGLPVDEYCENEWPCGCYFIDAKGETWVLNDPPRKLTKEEVEAKWPST